MEPYRSCLNSLPASFPPIPTINNSIEHANLDESLAKKKKNHVEHFNRLRAILRNVSFTYICLMPAMKKKPNPRGKSYSAPFCLRSGAKPSLSGCGVDALCHNKPPYIMFIYVLQACHNSLAFGAALPLCTLNSHVVTLNSGEFTLHKHSVL